MRAASEQAAKAAGAKEVCVPVDPRLPLAPLSPALARQVFGWPKRCQLIHAFPWEYSDKRLQLAQPLAQLASFSLMWHGSSAGFGLGIAIVPHGEYRARLHCRFVLPLIQFIPYLLTYSVPLFLKRQCDRTLAIGRRARPACACVGSVGVSVRLRLHLRGEGEFLPQLRRPPAFRRKPRLRQRVVLCRRQPL